MCIPTQCQVNKRIIYFTVMVLVITYFVINKYTKDFDRTPNRVSWIKMTQYSNNGNLYDVIPKEILFDSTENQTGKFMAKKGGDGPRRNINDTDQSTSILRNHTLNYPYIPFSVRTFGAEELENEKFTGM